MRLCRDLKLNCSRNLAGIFFQLSTLNHQLFWTSELAPAASPSRWPRNVQMQKLFRRTFQRTRWLWPKKTRREIKFQNGLSFYKATDLLQLPLIQNSI